MKDIYINGRYLSQQATGVQRFATEFVRALDEQLASGVLISHGNIFLIVPPGTFSVPKLNAIKLIKYGKLRGHAWEQLELPKISKDGLLFNPCGPAPIFHDNQVTVLHDASIHVAPAGYSWRFRFWHKLLMWRSGRNAKHILTVSHFSKRQLVDICGIPENKISVIYQSGDHFSRHTSDPSILERYGLRNGIPYILCVGSQQENKNMAAVVLAASILESEKLRFVVVGPTNSDVYRNSQPSHNNMTFTGYVTDGELHALYSSAACFVFPSLQEGFGIPPLEAMACGCPVIASNSSSIPEACGSAALYFDPKRPDLLSEAIMTILESPILREQLIRQGYEHSKLNSWNHTAAQIATHLWTIAANSN